MAEYCYKHTDTETLLHCGNCGRPICVKCVVQHPVGIRCRECARPTRVPTLDVTPVFYARAVAAAIGIGVAGFFGLILVSWLLSSLGPAGYYLRWLVLLGFGYLMGAGVGLAVNRKRGRGLQWVAGIGVAVTGLVAAPFLGLDLNNLFGLLMLGIAVYLAVNQLRV